MVNLPHTWHFVAKCLPPLLLKQLPNAQLAFLAMLCEKKGYSWFQNCSSVFLYISTNNKRRDILPRECKVSGDSIYSTSIISLTPAAFALVVRHTVTESFLFLQSSKIDLIINGYPEKIQVLFIGCQHLFSQSCESLGGKRNQRIPTRQER